MIVEKNRYLIKAKILIGNFLGAAPDEAFVELREPNTLELYELREKWAQAAGDQQKTLMALIDILPALVVSHNLFADEKTLCSKERAAEIILDKINLFEYVVAEYYDKVLFLIMPAKTEQGKADGEEKTG